MNDSRRRGYDGLVFNSWGEHAVQIANGSTHDSRCRGYDGLVFNSWGENGVAIENGSIGGVTTGWELTAV